jgi:hypothetical protein
MSKLAEVPKDPYDRLHWNMVHVHQIFKNGLERIIPLLKNPPKDDTVNLCGYLQAWATSIVAHHDTEELSVFPLLNTKVSMNREIEDHKVIHQGLDKFIEYIVECKKTPESFDAQKALTMLEDMKDVLISHLNEEVEDIAPTKLRAAGFSDKDMQEMMDSLTSEAQKHGDPFLVLPFMISHIPPEHKAAFPEAGWFIKKVLVPYVFARRYSGYWKYSPYAMS